MKYERHLGKGESLCCEYNHVVCDVCQMRLARKEVIKQLIF